jgi:hypothetical protein
MSSSCVEPGGLNTRPASGDLGIQPAPGTGPARVRPSLTSYAGAVVAQQVVSPVLVGRDEALTTLRETLATALSDGPAVALLAGEAGIGKSRLLPSSPGRCTPGYAW